MSTPFSLCDETDEAEDADEAEEEEMGIGVGFLTGFPPTMVIMKFPLWYTSGLLSGGVTGGEVMLMLVTCGFFSEVLLLLTGEGVVSLVSSRSFTCSSR